MRFLSPQSPDRNRTRLRLEIFGMRQASAYSAAFSLLRSGMIENRKFDSHSLRHLEFRPIPSVPPISPQAVASPSNMRRLQVRDLKPEVGILLENTARTNVRWPHRNALSSDVPRTGRFHATGSPRSFNISLHQRNAALAPGPTNCPMGKIG
jgi:hypothetical protein